MGKKNEYEEIIALQHKLKPKLNKLFPIIVF